jgi:hypothetical protein
MHNTLHHILAPRVYRASISIFVATSQHASQSQKICGFGPRPNPCRNNVSEHERSEFRSNSLTTIDRKTPMLVSRVRPPRRGVHVSSTHAVVSMFSRRQHRLSAQLQASRGGRPPRFAKSARNGAFATNIWHSSVLATNCHQLRFTTLAPPVTNDICNHSTEKEFANRVGSLILCMSGCGRRNNSS